MSNPKHDWLTLDAQKCIIQLLFIISNVDWYRVYGKFCIIKIFIIGSLHNSLHYSCVSHISINSQLNEFQLAFEARIWSRKETHTWEISVIRYQVFIWCSDVIMRIKTHTSIICFPLKYYLSSKLLLFINIYY